MLQNVYFIMLSGLLVYNSFLMTLPLISERSKRSELITAVVGYLIFQSLLILAVMSAHNTVQF